MQLKQYKSKIYALLQLVLFIAYLGSIALFSHLHIVNGHVVVHSHPYSGTADNPGHSHSPEQLLAINILTTLLAVIVIVKGIDKIYCRFSYLISVKCAHQYNNTQYLFNSLRGPPVG